MKKKWISAALSLTLASTTITTMMPAYTVHAEEAATQGTTYYISSAKGDDKNDGTSKDKPFKTLNKINELTLKPGDQVLLEKGSVFNDQYLHLKGSGSAETPITVSTYGEGNRPQINTNGQGIWKLNYGRPLDNQNHKWHGDVSSSILLKDVEYVEISGLELTNDRDTANDPEKGKAYNDADCMDRTGVAGVAKDKGTLDHIVLDDLYIHDVDGNVYNKHMTNGGIYFIVEKPTDESKTGIARYDDVQIKNCQLDTVNRWGIAVGYTYNWDKFQTAELSNEVMDKYASSDVVIENNYLNNVGGDAITTMYLDEPLVQYNVSENSSRQINTTDYSKQQPVLDKNGNPTGQLQGVGAGRVAAGIWPWKCKNAVFQYNECFRTLNASNGNGDGQPWDADYGDGTNYQYNYSHGNTASTIMFCGGQSINNTFRYNISQNEDMGPLDPAGNSGNTQVYNNTFYIKEGLNDIWHTSHGNGGPVNLENNIFYFAGQTEATVKNWNPSGNKTYSNNLFYNVSTYPDDTNAVKVKAGTKVVENAGSGPDAVATDKQARRHDDPTKTTVFDGYKLAENSPAINAGKMIVDKNGYTIVQDFFGNKVSGIPDIGAHESGTVGLTISSDRFAIDQAKKEITIDTIDKVTAKDLLDSLMTEDGVTVELKRGSATLTGGVRLAKGDTLVVSCNDEPVTYTVVTVTSEVANEIPVADMKATAGSEETTQGKDYAKNVLDGNLGTIWHSNWNGDSRDKLYLTIELTNDYEVNGYVYTPRQDGSGDGASNGTITKYEIQTSMDGKNWVQAASGDWKLDKAVKTVKFAKPVQAKYIKLVAVASHGGSTGKEFASAAEVRLTGTRVYTDTTAPAAPTVKATDVTDTTAKITWTPSADDKDIVEYQLMNGNTELATFDATETSFTVADLETATEYTLSVYAVDEAGNKSDAGNITFTTKAKEEHKHTWGEWTTTKEATCTTEGTKERTCVCGEKQTEVIPMTNHNWGEWETSKAATCTEDGLQVRHCTVCHTQATDTKVIKVAGHTWGDWKTTKEPTSKTEGMKERACKVCGAKETQAIAKLYSKPVTPPTSGKDNGKNKPVKTGDSGMAGATTACLLSGIAAVVVFKKRKTV